MDAIRVALGEATLSYYGVSWGADLGVVYSQLFGVRVDRMVVDSVTDVEGSEYHHLRTGERTEAAFDEWAAWVAWHDQQYGLGRTGVQVRATVTKLLAQAARKPLQLGQYKVDENALPFLLQSALGDESDRAVMARNVRTFVDAAAGRAVKPSDQLNGLMGQYYELDPAIDQFAAASFAFTCNDRGWPRDPAQYWRDLKKDSKAQPIFAANILPCAYWQDRTAEPELKIGNDVPMLIVQAERDNIPLVWAETLHQKLTRSALLTVDRRAHGVYDSRVPCMVSAVNTYLGAGAVSASCS
jgi:pimeloyl-ACP methyl ester carboxylesterase